MDINGNIINDNVINGETVYSDVTLLSIQKDIRERRVGDGPILSIQKRIKETIASHSLLEIQKTILNNDLPSTFYSRNGWDVFITLGGLTVDSGIITGGVQVVKQEDDNHSAEFTILLLPDIYDLHYFQGQDVTINVRISTGTYRIFTGVVDIPVVDVLEEKLTLKCIADRRALIDDLAMVEPYIGYYSDVVLGNGQSVYERMVSRLTTIPYALDFDSYNNATLTTWTPNAYADFTYDSGDVYRRNPQLIIESSGKIINTINLSMEYGFQRLHQRNAAYTWEHTYCPSNFVTGEGGICSFLIDRPSVPRKDMIMGAIQAAGWAVAADSIYFGKQFKSGNYFCSGVWASWSTIETGYFNAPINDSSGAAVNDASGNPLYRSVQTIVSDNTDLYTMYAAWQGYLRFNQNIRETYDVVVSAPSSVDLYGTLANTASHNIVNSNQYSTWENSNNSTAIPTDARLVSGDTALFYDGDSERYNFNIAFSSALNKAKTDILRTHRDTQIILQRFIEPTVELRHTVETIGKWVRGKGKCRRIVHNLCVSDCSYGTGGDAYTEMNLAQYRGVEAISETTLTAPSAPLDSYVPEQASIALQTHLGDDPSQPGAKYWNGYVGNIAVDESIPSYDSLSIVINHTRTNYQESFIVDTPDIPSEVRDEKVNAVSASYDINIPVDTTEYESYG